MSRYRILPRTLRAMDSGRWHPGHCLFLMFLHVLATSSCLLVRHPSKYSFVIHCQYGFVSSMQASVVLEGFTCLARPWTFQNFATVNGENQACRGATPTDNSVTYYEVVGDTSLDACKWSCVGRGSECKGIEFSAGRCEVWIRTQGIAATWPVQGFSCLRYSPQPQSLFVKKSKSRKTSFLGPSFVQTAYASDKQAEVFSLTSVEESSKEL